MRRALLALAAAVLLATTACAATGGGSGAPKATDAPTPTGGAPTADPDGY